MSQSRRKHPIHGVTTAKSEKSDKKITHQRLRSIVRDAIRKALKSDDFDYHIELWFDNKDISDVWSWSKDGKVYVSKSSPFYTKCMRK